MSNQKTSLTAMPIKEGMHPSKALRSLVKVSAYINHNGMKVYEAKCSASRCKFHEGGGGFKGTPGLTHNGAHRVAALHRRDKAYTAMHGAKRVQA